MRRLIGLCVLALLGNAIDARAQPPEPIADDDDTVTVPPKPPVANDKPAAETPPEAPANITPPSNGSASSEPPPPPVPSSPSAPAPASIAEPLARDDRLTLGALLSGAKRTRIRAWTHVDYGHYDISLDELSAGTREPLNNDRFSVRRAHVRLENEWTYAGYVAEIDFVGPRNEPRPVNVAVHAQLPGTDDAPPPLVLTVGLFPVPFTYQNQSQASFEIFFAERALFVDGFVPGRFDIGAAVSGRIWAVDWTLAVQNGHPLDSLDFAYRDPNRAKDYSGRVQVSGELVAGFRAATGVSFLKGTGFSPGTPPTKDTFEWRDLNEDGRVTVSELIPIPGAPGRASENYDRWGLAGDVRIWRDIPRLGELRIDAELALGENLDRFVAPADPVLLGRDQRGFGFYSSITQYVTPHAQLGLRYDRYEPNIDELELFEGRTVLTRRKFTTYTAGISGRLRLSTYARARVHVEYAHQRNSLGRDASGRPAHLENDAARVRFEVVF